ncbi:CDGSH iron-sulfur domain-containing protein [Crocosphaera sp. XPORK-15E]|nr:CDGSH iron-sulfur domain-containing protein [Crocosphaera sp. XPORK-15E]MEA5534830.1 CDGSH iron-sulfur domain-containing protein [Crocosphaera sp. XPORK-15E]
MATINFFIVLFSLIKFTLEETKKVALCLCKHSQNYPFCDGSHSKLSHE